MKAVLDIIGHIRSCYSGSSTLYLLASVRLALLCLAYALSGARPGLSLPHASMIALKRSSGPIWRPVALQNSSSQYRLAPMSVGAPPSTIGGSRKCVLFWIGAVWGVMRWS